MQQPRLKAITKPIFTVLGCTAVLAAAQDAPPTAPAAPVASNPLFDLGAGQEVPPTPLLPDPQPIPDAPPPPAFIGPEKNPVPKKEARPDRKWKVIPFAGFEVSWTDNLFASATRRRSDFFSIISPGLAAGWGDYGGEIRHLGSYGQHFEPLDLEPDNLPKNFTFGRYNLNATFFARNSDQNVVNHDAMIAGRWEGGKLTLGTRFYLQTLSDLDIEVGGRVNRTVYGGEITSNYSLTGKTSLELNLYNRSYDYSRQLSWQEWMVEDWVDYQIRPKTKLSFGTRLGIVGVQSSPTQTFEQLVGRVAYAANAKLGFSLDGGVEWRQFGAGGGDEVFGVFNLSATYTPFDGTLLSVNAHRRNSPSVVLSGDNIIATGVSALVRQRFQQRYLFTVEGGYENSVYQSRIAGAGRGREDNTTYIRSGVSFDVTRKLSVEAAFQHRRNDSSLADLSFTENVFIVQFKLRL